MLFADKAQFADADPAQNAAVDGVRQVAEGSRRMIEHGKSLYTPGDDRGVYRVETGALCHYVVWPDGSHDVIEFAFPGDIVGFGALAEHVSTAKAMVDTSVVTLSDAEFASALDADAALASRMASATDREFEFLRRRALQPGLRPVLNRVAAYLVAVAGEACRFGDTHVAAGTAGETAMAAMLDIPAREISFALNELREQGLVSDRDGSIVVDDMTALERIADA